MAETQAIKATIKRIVSLFILNDQQNIFKMGTQILSALKKQLQHLLEQHIFLNNKSIHTFYQHIYNKTTSYQKNSNPQFLYNRKQTCQTLNLKQVLLKQINVHKIHKKLIKIALIISQKLKKMRKMQSELEQEQYSELFSSPIQGIQMSNKRPNNGSPSQMTIQFCQSGSFKKIIEKENEDEQQNQHEGELLKLYDGHGNAICEFKTFDQGMDQVLPIIEDKQNDVPSANHLQTPLKNKELRSPLKDITPSITKRKKKSNLLQTISEKYTYLTPRTMAESRFSSSSGLRRIERL